MGIKGLTTFLDANTQLLTDFKFRNMKVVIDGNNLFHFLNTLYGVDDNYGGDYDHFASATFSFFGTLDQCNVTPIVLFDGPYIPSERKIGTSVKRAKERISLAYQLTLGLRGRATPIFCLDVFVSCLDAMSIKHVTCDGEADNEIAALANLYQCPVMTNDSDFFIFDIEGGVILLDYLNLRIRHDQDVSSSATEKNTSYIKVQIYYHRTLIDTFKLNADLVALFGTMLGNDKVETKMFEPFFSSEHLPNPGSKRNRILRLLLWLGEMETLENALKKILGHYKQRMHQEFQNVIMESVDSYRSIGVSHVHVPDDVFTNCVKKEFVSFVGYPPPEWFLTEMHRGRMSTLSANTFTSRKVILLAQPEDFSQKSAHDCAKLLRRVTYGILLQHDIKFHDFHIATNVPCSDNCTSVVTRKNIVVEEIDRDRRSQKRTLIEPVFTLNEKVIPSLIKINDLTDSEKIAYLCLTFGIKPDNPILSSCPKDLHLYLFSVSYWVSHAEPKLDLLHLTAVVLCLLKLCAVDHLASENQAECMEIPEENDANIVYDDSELVHKMVSAGTLHDFIKMNCSSAKIVSAKGFLDKFKQPKMKAKSKNAAVLFDVSVLHAFAQLQCVMQAAQALNDVLGSPLVRIPVADVFCGTFLFHCYRELRYRKTPDSYVLIMVGQCSLMNATVKMIRKLVMDTVEDNVIITEITPTRRCLKKKKVKEPEITVVAPSENDDKHDSDDAESKLVANCDLVNRFECLIEDSTL